MQAPTLETFTYMRIAPQLARCKACGEPYKEGDKLAVICESPADDEEWATFGLYHDACR
jgi:hypothetical protein